MKISRPVFFLVLLLLVLYYFQLYTSDYESGLKISMNLYFILNLAIRAGFLVCIYFVGRIILNKKVFNFFIIAYIILLILYSFIFLAEKIVCRNFGSNRFDFEFDKFRYLYLSITNLFTPVPLLIVWLYQRLINIYTSKK